MAHSVKYRRCSKCHELVSDVENCANCANRSPLSLNTPRGQVTGKRGAATLDIQEGNNDSWGDR